MRAVRESVLRSCRLRDGRLAWPVAQAMGLTESAFRRRLKKMSPDDAVSYGLQKPGRSEDSELKRAAFDAYMTNLERNSAVFKASALRSPEAGDLLHGVRALRRNVHRVSVRDPGDVSSPVYAAVLVETAGERLCLDPAAPTFHFQRVGKAGRWETIVETFDMVDMVSFLAGSGVWSVAATVCPIKVRRCWTLLESGDLPLLFELRPETPEGFRWIVDAWRGADGIWYQGARCPERSPGRPAKGRESPSERGSEGSGRWLQ